MTREDISSGRGDHANAGPLAGVRVLDLSRLVAGNMLTVTLADFGADVVKIERPGRGDDLRCWTAGGVENWWLAYGRNKRSVCLDLKMPTDLAAFKALTTHADVFVENFVPGKLEEMGLSPTTLLEINPRLIIVRVSGWGQTGPFAHKPGFGTLVEAMSGFANLNGFPDKPPALPPLATADMIAGLYGAFAVLAALRNVEQGDGKGQVIDLSLFESMFSVMASEAVKYATTGAVSSRMGNQAVNTAPRNIYTCADGKFLALSGSMQSMFERLATTIGRPDLIDDSRFRTNDARVENQDRLDGILGEYFARSSLADNLKMAEEAGVTAAPVLDMAGLMSHPYFIGRGIMENVTDQRGGESLLPTPVPRLSHTPGGFSRPAPELGEHTEEILNELSTQSDTKNRGDR